MDLFEYNYLRMHDRPYSVVVSNDLLSIYWHFFMLSELTLYWGRSQFGLALAIILQSTLNKVNK